MIATEKQINYLVFLANKVERLKKDDPQITVTFINWRKERSKGVTTVDASMRINAYKDIILWANVKRQLRNQKQL